ncbi:MAG: hypothetical protein ACYSWO_12240 [Planctomycetota bacterium]
MNLKASRWKVLVRPVRRCVLHTLISGLRCIRGAHRGLVGIDPLLVTHTVNRFDRTLKRNDMWHFGSVADGDWDLDGIPVQEYGHVYTILKKRTLLNLDYDEIPEFRENLERIKRGEKPDVCSSEQQYREKYIRFERLYETIKSSGYRTQRELKTGRPLNEIRIQVGRRGNLLFEEGMHRLCIAQLLKLDKIPVIITRCHAEWVARNGSRVYICPE